MRAVAGAEPPAVIARAECRHAAQVGARTDDDQIFLVPRLGALGVRLGLFQVRRMIVGDDALQFGRGAIAHEHRLALPFDDDLLAFLNLGQVELDRGQGQGVGGRVHLVDQGPGDHRARADRGGARRDIDEVATIGIAALGIARVLGMHDRFGQVSTSRSPQEKP